MADGRPAVMLTVGVFPGKHPASTAGREADPAGPAGSKMEREVRAVLCGQGPVPGGFPVPGQQLVHPGERPLGDAGQDISLRVDVREAKRARHDVRFGHGTSADFCLRARTSRPYHPEPEILKVGGS